jgi:hypothetical protein
MRRACPGLDGQKMSKSYGNTITLREDADSVTKKIRTMQTDPARVRRTDPGDPGQVPGVAVAPGLFRRRRQGLGAAGLPLGRHRLHRMQAAGDRWPCSRSRSRCRNAPEAYEEDPHLVRNIIADGCEKARKLAQETMRDVREAMGSTTEIKSRMLLPRPPKAENGEPEDPRAELVRRLIEYERMKASAAKLDEMPQAGRDYEWITVWIADKVVERQPDVSLHDLQVAWLSLMKQARVHQHHKIHREELSVREHMSIILRRLQGGGYVVFDQLFDLTLGAQGLVVSFLAMLELARESLIEITQNEAMAPIYVKLPDAAAV